MRRTSWACPFNGFQTAFGLLLSPVTPAALAEARARGTLDVLLTTLSNSGITGPEMRPARAFI
jgi:hypothetical protein